MTTANGNRHVREYLESYVLSVADRSPSNMRHLALGYTQTHIPTNKKFSYTVQLCLTELIVLCRSSQLRTATATSRYSLTWRLPFAVVMYTDTHTYKQKVLLYSTFMFNSKATANGNRYVREHLQGAP